MYIPHSNNYMVSGQSKPNNLQVAREAFERSKNKKLTNIEKAKLALKEKNEAVFTIVPNDKSDKLVAKILNELMNDPKIVDENFRRYFLGRGRKK